MKKYLLIFIIPLLFFTSSCEDETDTIQDTTLDSNLFGNWYCFPGYQYTMTLSSNGNFVWDEDYSDGSDRSSNSGIWWVEGNYLVLSGNSFGISSPYGFSGEELIYDWKTWTQQ